MRCRCAAPSRSRACSRSGAASWKRRSARWPCCWTAPGGRPSRCGMRARGVSAGWSWCGVATWRRGPRSCGTGSTSCAPPTSCPTTPACSAPWPRPWSGSVGYPRDSPPSTRRSAATSGTRSSGASRSCCASRPSCSCWPGGSQAPVVAEEHFQRALDWSRRHGAALRGRPRPALARAGADGRRARAAGAGLRTVHRGLRHPGAPGGPGPARPSRLAGRRGTGRGTVWP